MTLEEMVKEMEEQDEKNAQLQEDMDDEYIASLEKLDLSARDIDYTFRL